jgi:hypothetical protein
MRHQAPLTAGLIDIENAIENPPEVERGVLDDSYTSPFLCRYLSNT